MKAILLVIIAICPAVLYGQTAELKLSANTARACTIVTVDISGSEGDRVDLSIVPPISQKITDTGGERIYIVPNLPGQYTLVLTAFKGKTWDQATATLVVTAIGDDPAPPGPGGDDRYGLTAASRKHLPANTTAASRAAMRKWYTDFADKIVSDKMNNDRVFSETLKASKLQPWTDEWRTHYNELRLIMESAKLGLPLQWAGAYRDIAKGILK